MSSPAFRRWSLFQGNEHRGRAEGPQRESEFSTAGSSARFSCKLPRLATARGRFPAEPPTETSEGACVRGGGGTSLKTECERGESPGDTCSVNTSSSLRAAGLVVFFFFLKQDDPASFVHLMNRSLIIQSRYPRSSQRSLWIAVVTRRESVRLQGHQRDQKVVQWGGWGGGGVRERTAASRCIHNTRTHARTPKPTGATRHQYIYTLFFFPRLCEQHKPAPA